MLKILWVFISFLKELIVDKKDELNITSTSFSFKKSAEFLFIVISLLLNYFLIDRITYVSKKYIKLEQEHAQLVKIDNEVHFKEHDELVAAKSKLDLCTNYGKVKKHRP